MRYDADYSFDFVVAVRAQSSLFIEMAMILWAMNIERPKDANGKPAPMDLENCIEAGLVV